MRGHLVILSGPGGVGKDTILNAWMALNPQVKRVIAYTTRKPRPGETNHQDYHFVSLNEFKELESSGFFLEAKHVHENWYATPEADADALIDSGKIAILKIDVQGAVTVMEKRPDAISIFIMPPSLEELERRLWKDQGKRTDEDILIRIKNAHHELSFADRYQFKVVNNEVSRCVAEIEAIVQAASGT